MEDRENDDTISVDPIKDRLWELTNQSLADVTVNRGVHLGRRRNPIENRLHALRELGPEPRLLLLLTVERSVELSRRFSRQNNRHAHL